MPKKIEYYACDKCGKQYSTLKEAIACEAIPVKQQNAVAGDSVIVLSGECTGQKAVVRRTHVVKPGWGPAQYDHTVSLIADIQDALGGTRLLTFDAYRKV